MCCENGYTYIFSRKNYTLPLFRENEYHLQVVMLVISFTCLFYVSAANNR